VIGSAVYFSGGPLADGFDRHLRTQLFVAAQAPASVTTPVHRTRLSKEPESPIFQ